MTTGTAKPKHWAIVAAFFTGTEPVWLDDFIEDDGYAFTKVLPDDAQPDWHHVRAKRTSAGGWAAHLRQARRTFRQRPDGIVTCFPQLAMCAALLKCLGRHRPPIVAYNFNLGGLYGGLRGRAARFLARYIDVFVVHSPSEVESYAAYLNVPPERVQFIPLQRGEIEQQRREDTGDPFILSMGSAHRDYATLIEAVDALKIRTVIVARPDMIEALPSSPHVEVRSGLTQDECLDLLAKARLSVTPISNLETASGQVTFVNAMRLGVPVIATRCPGTDGYIEHDRTGLLVAPFDTDDLRGAIARLWQDDDQRRALAEAGRVAAEQQFSDQAVARRLHAVLEQLG
jgi:glycosyltransferase involved in cell wall biosynthesis